LFKLLFHFFGLIYLQFTVSLYCCKGDTASLWETAICVTPEPTD